MPDLKSFDSSPLIIRPMFFLCVKIRATDTTIEKILNTVDGVSNTKNSNSGKAIPALIDETDTIFVNKSTTRKTPKQLSVSSG